MNLKFMRRVSERERAIRQFVIVKNKLMSVFNASVLLLTMNFVITLQCFRQTAPLRESRVAFREGPKKNDRHSTLIATPRLKIATDMVANELTIYNATNVSFLAT